LIKISSITHLDDLSHSLKLADALIGGATAVSFGRPILTGNDKHYKVIKDVQVKKFRP
jgi:predicted nucleic acid-binding protein